MNFEFKKCGGEDMTQMLVTKLKVQLNVMKSC